LGRGGGENRAFVSGYGYSGIEGGREEREKKNRSSTVEGLHVQKEEWGSENAKGGHPLEVRASGKTIFEEKS